MKDDRSPPPGKGALEGVRRAVMLVGEQPGDPRKSLEERYPTHQDYVDKVTAAANSLKADRFLLDADVQVHINAANAASVP